MDVLLPIYQLLNFIIHFLASLALSVLDTFYILHRVCLHVYYTIRGRNAPVYRIQEDAAQLKKIPQHIGLVCIGKKINYIAHLANVIRWAVGYGVRYVSLYDAHGVLKGQKSVIIQALENDAVKINYTIFTRNTEMHQMTDVVESDSSGPNVMINLFSMVDGKGNLTAIARHLSSGVNKISDVMLQQRTVTQSQPDPEVVITIGEPLATLGFLPWQIRLSEFFAVPSLNRFEYGDFRNILRKYSKCEQRFGK